MLVGGSDIAVARRGDVVHAEDEVVGGVDALRPLHQVGVPQQRDEVAGAGGRDRAMQAGERADVNHARYIALRMGTAKRRAISAMDNSINRVQAARPD